MVRAGELYDELRSNLIRYIHLSRMLNGISWGAPSLTDRWCWLPAFVFFAGTSCGTTMKRASSGKTMTRRTRGRERARGRLPDGLHSLSWSCPSPTQHCIGRHMGCIQAATQPQLGWSFPAISQLEVNQNVVKSLAYSWDSGGITASPNIQNIYICLHR